MTVIKNVNVKKREQKREHYLKRTIYEIYELEMTLNDVF